MLQWLLGTPLSVSFLKWNVQMELPSLHYLNISYHFVPAIFWGFDFELRLKC